MNDRMLTILAFHILEVWLLTLGFQPSGGWNDDPNCVRDYGPHRVWTVDAHIPDGMALDRELLWEDLNVYIQAHNSLPTAVKFGAYGIDIYDCPYGSGKYIYVSIYQ